MYTVKKTVLKKILIIDKTNIFSDYFKSILELNYDDNYVSSLNNIQESDLLKKDIVMIVLYDLYDLFELLKIYNQPVSVIIASYKPDILCKLIKLNYAYIINLQKDTLKIKTDIINSLNQINTIFHN